MQATINGLKEKLRVFEAELLEKEVELTELKKKADVVNVLREKRQNLIHAIDRLTEFMSNETTPVLETAPSTAGVDWPT
jgi:hypothetical protein